MSASLRRARLTVRAGRLAAGVAALALAACTGAPRPIVVAAARPERAAPAARWVDSVLSTLTLRQKAAQMVWPTILGDYTHAGSSQWRLLREQIQTEGVGGYTVSVGSPLEIAAKLNAMQRMSAVPLLFGADFEFGAGYRARGGHFLPNAIDLGGAVVFPPQMALGAARDTALAYEQGRVTAIEGRAIGVHIVYAPILDVNNNPANPVINTRSYGEDPQLAGALGASFIRGVQEHGMLATGKHFPGHGDTEINSHLALPVVDVSRARLDSIELLPFRAGIDAGVGAIMTFHGALPALDSTGAPATLSTAVLHGLLREEMRFDGLVISDAMDMRGVLDRYGAAGATKRAVRAGADILIQPVDVRQAIDAIVAGVREGVYDEARLDRSVRRILETKQRMALDRERTVDLDRAREVVGDSAHQATAIEIARRSITLVKDSLHQLPLHRLPRATRVMSITVARRSNLLAGGALNAELQRRFPRLRGEFVNADAPTADFARLLPAADSADVVILGSYVSHAWNATTATASAEFVAFVDALLARGRRPILLAMGNPYLLQQIPAVPAYVVAWGGSPVSQQAAARAILGLTPITGRLPISIPPTIPVGAGEHRVAAAGALNGRRSNR